jgi:hypothetical protein
MKPQRPSTLEIKHPPANAYHTSTTYNGTHTDIHVTQNIMQEKLLCYIKLANACIYKVFLSSLWLSSTQSSLIYNNLLKMRYQNLFYLRGSSSASLQVYLLYSITLNGLSSPESDLDLSHYTH